MWITVVVCCCGTTFFLDTLVLPTDPEPDLRAGLRAVVCPRATLPVEAADLLLSRIDLPIRRFVLLLIPPVPTRLRATLDFAGVETDGVRLPIEPPIREIRPDEEPTLEVRPELAAGCLTPVGVEGLLVPIEPPIRPGDLRSEPVPVEREIRPAFERLLEGAAGCFVTVETDGLSILIELPMRDLEPEAGRSILIDRLDHGTIEGVLVLMEPPIRDLLLGLIRMPELLLTEVEPVGLLVMDVPDEGLRRLEELEGLEIVIRLDDPLGLLLIEIVPERVGVDRLTDILPELLRIEIELERLGIDRITDILLELPPRLGTDRLDDIELDRLDVGARLTDDLLELLRLGVDRLMDDRLELLRLGTDRLEVIVRDRLGVGDLLTDDLLELLRLGIDRLIDDRLGVDRLTDDLLELLRLGVLARAGGADLATDVFALELRELELFLELLPAKTGSTARVNSKMKKINRKLKPCSERSRRLVNRNLFL